MNSKLKIAVFCLVAGLAVGFAVYRIFTLDDDYGTDDAEARAALKWLRLADRGNFEECRKNAADPEKWLDLFKKNRESLEKLKSRSLRSKSIDRNGTYKIIFNSAFGKAPGIDEIVWVGKDAKVWLVKYKYAWIPAPWRSQDTGSPEEVQEIRNLASGAVTAMNKLDAEFFTRIKDGKRTFSRLKRQTEQLGYPYKYNISNQIRFSRNIPGMTEIETALAVIGCLYRVNGKNYWNSAVLILNKNTSAAQPHWEIQSFYLGRAREQKMPQTNEAKK